MPSTYAHYRMGEQVRKHMSAGQKRVVGKGQSLQLYRIGLHGPDIFFYYHPLLKSAVNRTGGQVHDRSGGEFFRHARQVVLRHPGDDRYLAYVYGVLNHFALDVTCHGYIAEKIAESGVSHGEIEVEFDRELMLRDGKDPVRQTLTNHILPSRENARVIAAFYPGITARQIESALRGMIVYNRLLLAPSRTYRRVLFSVLKLAGKYESLHGQVVNYHANPACADSTRKLLGLYRIASGRAIDFLGEFDSYLREGKPLGALFSLNFGSVPAEAKGEGR